MLHNGRDLYAVPVLNGYLGNHVCAENMHIEWFESPDEAKDFAAKNFGVYYDEQDGCVSFLEPQVSLSPETAAAVACLSLEYEVEGM